VVTQHSHILFHGGAPVGIGESGANRGGDRGGSWSSVGCQNQWIDGTENSNQATCHHLVDVAGVAWRTGGTPMAQSRNEPAGWGDRWIDPPVTVVNAGGVGEACRVGCR
jgi:hypothetical protein